MAGQAINRLETHLFSLVKIVLDSDLTTWEGFQAAQKELQGEEDLLVYWKVKEPDAPEDEKVEVKENSNTSS